MSRHHQPHPAHAPTETDDLNAVGGHCPRCLIDYRPGFHVCADCDVPLVPGPGAAARGVAPGHPVAPNGPERSMAEVVTLCSLGWEEAWLMAGRLRAEGIPALVSPDDYAAYSRFHLRTFDVVVRADQLAEARRIAAAFAHA